MKTEQTTVTVSFGGISAPLMASTTFTTDPADPNSYATFVNIDDAVNWFNSRSTHWMATVAFNAGH